MFGLGSSHLVDSRRLDIYIFWAKAIWAWDRLVSRRALARPKCAVNNLGCISFKERKKNIIKNDFIVFNYLMKNFKRNQI